MATQDWSAAYENTPAGSDSISGGDDQIRNLKRDIRERAKQGGHLMQKLGADNVRDGRHVVDAGGAGVSPSIYKSNETDLLVEYTDVLVRIYEALQVDKDTTIKGVTQLEKLLKFEGAAKVAAGSGATVLGLDAIAVDVDTSGGNATITLPPANAANATGKFVWIGKRNAANSVTIQPPALSFCIHGDGSTGAKTYTSGRTNAWFCVTTSFGFWFVFEMDRRDISTAAVINVTNAAANPTALDDFVFLTTNVPGTFNVNLHAAGTSRPKGALSVRHINGGAGTIQIVPNGTDTINGAAAPFALGVGGSTRVMQNTATNWVTL